MFVLFHQIPEESDEKHFAFDEKKLQMNNGGCSCRTCTTSYWLLVTGYLNRPGTIFRTAPVKPAVLLTIVNFTGQAKAQRTLRLYFFLIGVVDQ